MVSYGLETFTIILGKKRVKPKPDKLKRPKTKLTSETNPQQHQSTWLACVRPWVPPLMGATRPNKAKQPTNVFRIKSTVGGVVVIFWLQLNKKGKAYQISSGFWNLKFLNMYFHYMSEYGLNPKPGLKIDALQNCHN